jgi:hypothetical protein
MSDEIRSRISELQNEAWNLPAGATKVSLLEEAVRLADSVSDVPLAYELRDELMEAATFSNRSDILLVAFTWCLAQYDKDPEQFDEHGIMWKYKWVVSNATDFAEISRAQIESLLGDMERRFHERGYSMHAPYQMRRDVLVLLGDHEKAREAHEKFMKTRPDWLSDCNACVPSNNAQYFAFQGDDRKTLQAAKPLLEGKLSCAEEPRRTYGEVLLPLLKSGRIEEAEVYHKKGYKMLAKAEHAVSELAQHLEFASLSGDLARAKRMLEKHLPAALTTVVALDRYWFYSAARLLMNRLQQTGTVALKLRLPEAMPPPDAKGKYDVAQLGQWFEREARSIAERYDARDGNNRYAEQLERQPELLRLAANS